jgi:hypothetical protein
MGITIQNQTQYDFRFVPYRLDGIVLEEDVPKINPGECFHLKNHKFKEIDAVIVLAFLKDSEIPPAVGVKEAMTGSSGGGGFEISIAGFGFGLSGDGGKTKTKEYSSPIAHHVMGRNEAFIFQETDPERHKYHFIKSPEELQCSKIREA